MSERHPAATAVTPDLDELARLALAMRERAYAPYSKFHVGAVVKSDDGSLHAGCNVENSAYPQGWCAEPSVTQAASRYVRMAACRLAS